MPARASDTSAAALSGAIALLVGLFTLNHLPVGGFYDDGFYVIFAKSIATGHGYRYLNLPGTPFSTHYPPGYPALLALLWKVGPAFPANLVLFKAANAVLLGAIAYATCTFATRVLDLPPPLGVVAALLGTITIPPLVLTNLLLSEPLFLALLIPALMLAEHTVRSGASRRDAIALGVLCAMLVLVRTIGALIVVAIGGAYVATRAWRGGAWYVGTTLALVTPWMSFTSRHSNDVPMALRGAHGSYLGWFSGGVRAEGLALLWHTAIVNVKAMGAGLAPSFRVIAASAMTAIVLLSLAFLWAVGAWRARHRAPVSLAFLALYAGLIVVWPASPLRFLWGVWPLLMLLLVAPLDLLWNAESPRRLKVAVAVAALCLVPGILRYNAQGYHGGWWGSIARSTATPAGPPIQWVRTHAATNDVIASELEAMIYLYAGRQAVPLATFTAKEYLHERSAAENAEVLRGIVQTFRARYVIVWSAPDLAVARMLATGPSPALTLADSLAGAYVFSVTATDSTRR